MGSSDSVPVDNAILCRGSFTFGSACGKCQRCKANAFDWLETHSTALDEWAILQTGHHDIMKAIMQQCRDDSKPRLPQRFRYRKPGCNEWDFGVCYPMGKRWKIQAAVGFGSFDSDPWEHLGQIIGDVSDFKWIDNDYGWKDA